MTALVDGQYEAGGFLLGTDTPYKVLRFEDGGLPERTTEDVGHAFDDGVAFGRDTFGGFLHAFEILVETAGGGPSFDAVGALRKAWRGDSVRRTPGAVEVLRIKRPGAPARKAYGRFGKCTPVMSRRSGVGLVPVVADFRGADDRWYADESESVTIGTVSESTGGFVFPLTFPAQTGPAGERPGIIFNDGDLPTWPVIEIRGPVTNPYVSLRDDEGVPVWDLSFTTTLAAGQTITVDTRPWARTVLRENGGNAEGRNIWSTATADMEIPPGSWVFVYGGADPTATSTATLTIEPASASY